MDTYLALQVTPTQHFLPSYNGASSIQGESFFPFFFQLHMLRQLSGSLGDIQHGGEGRVDGDNLWAMQG